MLCRVLMEHFEELLPIVSTPTVREACRKYGLMFKSLPRGLFVTLEDRGRVFRWDHMTGLTAHSWAGLAAAPYACSNTTSSSKKQLM
jgi:hypothetical protein